MARSVLRSVPVGLMVAIPAILAACGGRSPGPPAAEAILTCAGDLSKSSAEIQEAFPKLRERVESGPFYGVLKQRLGNPDSCQHQEVEGSLRLSYTFARGGGLEARVDPTLDSSEERLSCDGLTPSEAMSLLEAEQRHAFGNEGCGIDLGSGAPETEEGEPGLRDEIYRGEVCNCQARVQYREGRLAALIFRSAC